MQAELPGEYPEVVVGYVVGSSNFGGVAFPFVRENLTNGRNSGLVTVEPTSCPTLTIGQFTHDFCNTVGNDPDDEDVYLRTLVRVAWNPRWEPALLR